MNMRVVYVAPFGLRQKTTVWARTLPMARQVVRHGGRATILVPPWDSPGDAGKRWHVQGVEIIHTSLAGRVFGVTFQLMDALRQLQPDIVHIVKPRAYAGIVQWLLWMDRVLNGRKRPTVLLDVDDWEQAWTRIAGYRPPLSIFLNWQERWGIAHARFITAASRWLEATASRQTPAVPVLYLPNGVSPASGRPEKRIFDAQRPPTVLLFSRFVEVDPQWLAGFLTAAQTSMPQLHLLVAGRALQPAQERRFAKALAARENVTWMGYVEPDTLADLYRRVDCAIFPAEPTPLNLAKCSVRLATTLLHGVPVVASAVGEQTNYGRAGGAHLVPADAPPKEFAAQVVETLNQPPRSLQEVVDARNRLLSQYKWSRLGKQLLGFYEDAVESLM